MGFTYCIAQSPAIVEGVSVDIEVRCNQRCGTGGGNAQSDHGLSAQELPDAGMKEGFFSATLLKGRRLRDEDAESMPTVNRGRVGLGRPVSRARHKTSAL